MPEKTKKWLEFEKDTESFLKRVGFSDVEHDQNFFPDNDTRYQIDLICGIDSHALILDCKMKEKSSPKPNITEWIDKMNGRRQNFEKQLKNNTKYKKYSTTHLVLVLGEGITPNEKERNYAKLQRISIWDSRFISYYNQYSTALLKLIPYHILGDMGAKISEKAMRSVVAFKSTIKIENREYESYLFSASPSELLKHSYVARREQGGKDFYQRIINTAKLNSVYDYVKAGGSFVNNIVLAYDQENSEDELSFDPAPKELAKKANDELIKKLDNPEYNMTPGILQFPLGYKSFWVIDGQHRLFGYAMADKKIQDNSSLPVILIKDISLRGQMKLFVDINRKQKTINADLIWDIYGDIEPESILGCISNIVKEIDLSGPLAGKIKIPSRRPRAQINLSSFCRAIEKTGLMKNQIKWMPISNPFFVENNFYKTANNLVSVLNDYFSFLEKNLEKEKYESILNSTSIEIFIAFFSLLVAILRRSDTSEQRKVKFAQQMKSLNSTLDSQQLRDIRKATGESLKDEQTRKLLFLVIKDTQDPKLLEIFTDISDSNLNFKGLEPGMREWLGILFKEYTPDKKTFDDWFKKTRPNVFDKEKYAQLIHQNEKQVGYKGQKKMLLDALDLGSIAMLLTDSAIKDLFNKCRDEIGTLLPKDISSHMHFITPHRNTDAHESPPFRGPSEEKQAKVSTEILMKEIEKVREYFTDSENPDFEEENSE